MFILEPQPWGSYASKKKMCVSLVICSSIMIECTLLPLLPFSPVLIIFQTWWIWQQCRRLLNIRWICAGGVWSWFPVHWKLYRPICSIEIQNIYWIYVNQALLRSESSDHHWKFSYKWSCNRWIGWLAEFVKVHDHYLWPMHGVTILLEALDIKAISARVIGMSKLNLVQLVIATPISTCTCNEAAT